MTTETSQDSSPHGIAIVGLAGRFPGAGDVQAFWDNLFAARESISSLRRDDVAPGEPVGDPHYVLRRGVMEEAECFEADFFGLSRIEAEVTDPQQRVFLEIAWTALEHAGYDPHRLPGACGVWAGTGNNHYFQKQLAANAELIESAGAEAVMIGNEKDYLATRVAYRLNLRGPAINVVTTCSTNLVAVAQAVHGLMTFQCDLALAGGSSTRWPQNRGYLHQCAEPDLAMPDTLDLAAVNEPDRCVISGAEDAIIAFESDSAARGVGTKRLRTSHAFHSRLMDGALEEFRRAFDGVVLHPPRARVISNLTGGTLTAEQATSPDSWVRHLRAPVRFAAIEKAARSGERAPENLRPMEAREAHMKLMEAYQLEPFAGTMTLLRCSGANDKFEHTPALGWEGVVRGRLEVIEVTGTHLRLFDEPHVTILAEKLAASLAGEPADVGAQ